MAIEFDCPHCQLHYRLKDELAGKTATCKNCRKKIVIPEAGPNDAEAAEAAEAAALKALNEEPAKNEQEEAAKKIIPVECPHCNHKWTEPIERAGKNALCKNPECKQRIKIPEPKDEGQYDWRQTKTQGPSLAKKNVEKPKDVQDAGDVKQLSDATVRKTILEEELEPRPLRQKVMFVLLAAAAVGGAAFGIRSCVTTTTTNQEDRLMQDAQEEFAKGAESYAKDELPLDTAVLHIAAGEHALRHNKKEKLKEALDQFAKAREVLRPGIAPARNALCGELAVALLMLGGTEEQARDQVRIRWTQETGGRYQPNERVFNVFEELRTTLALVQGADLDFRTHLARRLTRELVKHGQPALAVELIPLALFNQAELPEAKAVVALEVHRAERGSSVARTVADDLKGRSAEALRSAPSAQILFSALKTEKAPAPFSPPGPGAVTDPVRYAYTGILVLEDKPKEALELASRQTSLPDQQLRALTLYADLAVDAGPALDVASGVLAANKDRKDAKVSPYFALRLAQIAATVGRHEQAKQFALSIPDESLKAWAQGEVVRIRLAAAPKDKGDEGWVELPDDPKKFRAGHAWARLWLARQSARISGDRAAAVKEVSAWPSPLVPFGKAGVALGLQDNNKALGPQDK
jgi:hypothetical protein